MAEFHGYDQHPDALPGLPWWRLHYNPQGIWLWIRIDGETGPLSAGLWRIEGTRAPGFDRFALVTAAERTVLKSIDRDKPMAVPAPKCNQVWAYDAGGSDKRGAFCHVTVAHVYDVGDEDRVTWGGGSNPWRYTDGDWPPKSAVLVSGQGSPWAPPEVPTDE